MRDRRRTVVGTVVVTAYAVALAAAAWQAVVDSDLDRRSLEPEAVAARFVEAWGRSRTATFVTTGTYERRSEVSGAAITSENVVAQRPPQRLHRQLGGIEGRDDARLLVCPAPPAGVEEREPCRLGPPGPITYAESVAREVDGLASLTTGTDPLYRVREPSPGCFELALTRPDPRAPFGVAASFCFDADTGAPTSSRVRYEGGVVEVAVVTSIRTDVTDADLRP